MGSKKPLEAPKATTLKSENLMRFAGRNNPMAANVWDCLEKYEISKAKELSKKYSYDDKAVIKALESYPGKHKYHGHGTDPNGGTNSGGDTNRKEAIAFLEKQNAPPPPDNKTKDKTREKANRSKIETLVEIIRENQQKTVSQMLTALDDEDPDWEGYRDVWSQYSVYYRAQKNKEPQKRKKS